MYSMTYDMTGNPFREEDGWNRETRMESVEVIHVTREVSEDVMEGSVDHKHMIKRELARELADELLKENKIEFREQKDLYKFSTLFNASIRVVNNSVNYVNLEGTVFKVNGKEFREDEIIEAIKETFPERLI